MEKRNFNNFANSSWHHNSNLIKSLIFSSGYSLEAALYHLECITWQYCVRNKLKKEGDRLETWKNNPEMIFFGLVTPKVAANEVHFKSLFQSLFYSLLPCLPILLVFPSLHTVFDMHLLPIIKITTASLGKKCTQDRQLQKRNHAKKIELE